MLSIINNENSITFDNKTFYLLEKDVGSIEATINSTKGIGQDGAFYNSSYLNERDITIKGALWTRGADITPAKKQLINLINPYDKLIIKEGTYTIEAFAKETVRFNVVNVDTEKDYLEFLITLYCPSPFWTNEEGNTVDLSTWVNNFSFELEIPSEGIEFGFKNEEGISNLYNEGSLKTGLEIVLQATSTIANPKVFNIYTLKNIKLNYTMSVGETITINTNYGKKRITSSKNGNIINYLDFESEFLQLESGDNWLKLESDNGTDNLLCTCKFNEKILEV